MRVNDNTILVTYYNSPDVDKLRVHYENLPAERKPRASTHGFPGSMDLNSIFASDKI